MRSNEAKKGSGAAKLHRAGEDYLKTILALQMAYGGVRSADVAKELNVSKASVCNAIKRLRADGFLTMAPNKLLRLTDQGREAAERIPNLLPILKPCMMMSPLSVSQFLQSENYSFDMVIFDEASQVKTENAVGAISRSEQLIVAGDIHQLPPTNFFSATLAGNDEYDEEEEDDSDAFESVLDETVDILPQLTLKWHYRSKNENLITFSNRKIYNNSLVTFPSPSEEGENPRHRHCRPERGKAAAGSVEA